MTIPHSPSDCLPAVAQTVVSLPACPGRLVRVTLSAGDTIRADRGLVWYTIDGRLDDVFLAAGEQRTMADDTTISVTGFGRTDFSLISSRPHPRFVGHGGVRPYRQDSGLKRLLALARSGLGAATRLMPSAPAH